MFPGDVNLNNDFQSQVRRFWPFLPDSIKGVIFFMMALFEEALRFFAAPVEMVLRCRFGPRGLPTFLAFQLVVSGFSIAGIATRFDLALATFGLLVSVTTVVHYWESRQREWSRTRYRHSYSDGEPNLVWNWCYQRIARVVRIDADQRWFRQLIWRALEPALCLALGAGMTGLNFKFLGYYLMGASIALAIKAHLHAMRALNFERDRCDAELLGNWMAETKHGGAPQLTAFVVELASTNISPKYLESEKTPPEDYERLLNIASTAPSPITNTVKKNTPEPKITIVCKGCRARLQTSTKTTTRSTKCPACQSPVLIPGTKRSVAATPNPTGKS